MPYLLHEGRKIYYETSGTGPALLLVRGLSRSLRFWSPLLPELERDFRVIVFDHRGIGRSESAGGAFYSTSDLAADAVRVLDACNVERAHVFGLSMGGMVAQWLALEHPTRVDRLVLGSTRAGGEAAPRPRISSFVCIAASGMLPQRYAVRMSARWIVSPDFLRRDPRATDDWQRWLASDGTSVSTLIRQVRAAWMHDVGDRLHEISAPTLVVTGDADRLVPAANSAQIAAAISVARLEVLPGAGHDFPAECPRKTVELVRAHCRGR